MRVFPSFAAPLLVSHLTTIAVTAGPIELDNVTLQDGRYVLAAGPNVEGVVLLRQGRWVSRPFRPVCRRYPLPGCLNRLPRTLSRMSL